MSQAYERVKGFLLDLGVRIEREDEAEHLLVVSSEEDGIVNLIVDCEEDILILQQHILTLPAGENHDLLRRLLEMNLSLVHGAFALDTENRVIFRDTLRLATLDFEEIAASIQALSLGIAEYGVELMNFAIEPVTV